MRGTLLLSAALLGLTYGPALAQNPPPSTMSPPMPDAGMTGMHPMRGQMHHGAGTGAGARGRVAHGTAAHASAASGDAADGHEYRGGAGSPFSSRASNIGAANTRSEIAPRLPDTAPAGATPEGYLAAAQRSLNAGQTGAAQEALERAETRLLSRSTDPSMASTPSDMPMVQQIGIARRALATRDTAAAKAAISAAMGNGT